jgi:DinB superfamily
MDREQPPLLPVDRSDLAWQFKEAIDRLEAALEACPASLWRASMWHVSRSDPWVWPKAGREPVPERTDETIQGFSTVATIACHCIWFLDFYQSPDPAGFQSPEYVRGGPEEMPWPADGAAPIPDRFFSKDVLLRYLSYGRGKLGALLASVTDTELSQPCLPGHPHAGSTLLELLNVNLHHVREHGDSIHDFLVRNGVDPGILISPED